MAGLVGITLLQLFTILQKGIEETVRFCQTFGLLPKRYRCPVFVSDGVILKYSIAQHPLKGL